MKVFKQRDWNETKSNDAWSIFKIMGEFVMGFEALQRIGPCISIYGSARMKEGLRSLGYNLGDSETPILPVYCGSLMTAFTICKRLQEEGVFVNPVVSPAVAPGRELIRLSLMATHTDKQIDFALDKLKKVGKELALI